MGIGESKLSPAIETKLRKAIEAVNVGLGSLLEQLAIADTPEMSVNIAPKMLDKAKKAVEDNQAFIAEIEQLFTEATAATPDRIKVIMDKVKVCKKTCKDLSNKLEECMHEDTQSD